MAVQVQAGFIKEQAVVNSEIPFLVELFVPTDVRFETLQFDALRLTFSNGKTCVVRHVDRGERGLWTDLGEVSTVESSAKADLHCRPGEVRLYRGTIRSADPGALEVKAATQKVILG